MALDPNDVVASTGRPNAYTGGEAVTPSDTAELTQTARAIHVGGAGNLSVVTAEDDTVVINGVQAGAIIPLLVKQVTAANTTATNITALW